MAQETTKSGQINNFILNKLLPSLSKNRTATESSSRQLWKDSYDMDKGFFDHIISNQDLILKDPIYRGAINGIIQDHNWKTQQGQEVLSKFLTNYLGSAQANWKDLDKEQVLLEGNSEYNFVSWQKKNYPVVAGSPIGMGATADRQEYTFSETINKRVAFLEDIIKRGETFNHPAAKLAAMHLPNWKAAWGFLQSGGDLTYLEALASQNKEGAEALKEAIKTQSQTFIEKALTGEKGMSPEDESLHEIFKEEYEIIQPMLVKASKDFYRSFKTESETTEKFNMMFMDAFGKGYDVDKAVTGGSGEIKTGDISYYPINVSDKRLENFVTQLAVDKINEDLLVQYTQLKKLNSEIFRITEGQLTLWGKYKKDDAKWGEEEYAALAGAIMSGRLYGTDKLGITEGQINNYLEGLNINLTIGDIINENLSTEIPGEDLEKISDSSEEKDTGQDFETTLEDTAFATPSLPEGTNAKLRRQLEGFLGQGGRLPVVSPEKPEVKIPDEELEPLTPLGDVSMEAPAKWLKEEYGIKSEKGDAFYIDAEPIPTKTIDYIGDNYIYKKGIDTGGKAEGNVDVWFADNKLDHYTLTVLKNAVDKNTVFSVGGDAIKRIKILSPLVEKQLENAHYSANLIQDEFYRNNPNRSIDEFYDWLGNYSGSVNYTKRDFSELLVNVAKASEITKPEGVIRHPSEKGRFGTGLISQQIKKYGLSPKELVGEKVYGWFSLPAVPLLTTGGILSSKEMPGGERVELEIGRVFRDKNTGVWKFFPRRKPGFKGRKIAYNLDDFTLVDVNVGSPDKVQQSKFSNVATQNPEDYQKEFNTIEDEFGLSRGLLSAIMETETGGTTADSLKASFQREQAIGSFQQRPIFIKDIKRITKGTPHEEEMANYDPNDPIQAAKATAIYINYLKTKRNMVENQAIRSYNAGELGSTNKAVKVSQAYLKKVKTKQRRYMNK